jgi:hypothetical protein
MESTERGDSHGAALARPAVDFKIKSASEKPEALLHLAVRV